MSVGKERANAIALHMQQKDKRLEGNSYHDGWYKIDEIQRGLTISKAKALYGLTVGISWGMFERRESKHYGYWWWYEYRLAPQPHVVSEANCDHEEKDGTCRKCGYRWF